MNFLASFSETEIHSKHLMGEPLTRIMLHAGTYTAIPSELRLLKMHESPHSHMTSTGRDYGIHICRDQKSQRSLMVYKKI